MKDPEEGSNRTRLFRDTKHQSIARAPWCFSVDVEAEKARLTKAMEASQKEFGSLDKRLSNPSFVEKAKPEAVEKAKADAAHHAAEIDRLRDALARLG